MFKARNIQTKSSRLEFRNLDLLFVWDLGFVIWDFVFLHIKVSPHGPKTGDRSERDTGADNNQKELAEVREVVPEEVEAAEKRFGGVPEIIGYSSVRNFMDNNGKN